MEKKSDIYWPEIVFSTKDSKESRRIQRAVIKRQLRKIAPRIYTANLVDKPEDIIRRNCYFILNKLFPNALISHRSALEGGLTQSGLIILTYKYTKKISLPGLTIRLIEGSGPLDSDTPFMEHLFISSRPRALLENLQVSKGRYIKTVSRDYLESVLDNLCRVYGEDELNRIRDQSKAIAGTLGLLKEFKKLSEIISTLLGTHNAALKSDRAKARAQGLPFDAYRNELFAHLFAKLKQGVFAVSNNKYTSDLALKNTAFFEAYFSNFIEGTEFTLEEAEDIIFHRHIMASRPEDAHDILSTYEIVSSLNEMEHVPDSFDELLSLLTHRHHILMSARPDKAPDVFKEIQNRAGDTVFVNPELVKGTLLKGFEFYQKLESGLPRAIFMMFLISEVHPFVDGNGRIARIMMNAELEAVKQTRIIIPTVYREDYLLTLRALSRSQQVDGYIHMLVHAQAFTHSIDFSNFQKARQQLTRANAFKSPFIAKLEF